MMDRDRLTGWVTMICAMSMSLVLVGMVLAMTVGLFDDRVDNVEIFKMLGPAFNTIVGGFIGLVTGIRIASKDE
jgi:UDP-N-acetylmuramyl pentapeptide phosphotransferase/UDP-N-acetylglucosamine-1-phosphate transferase